MTTIKEVKKMSRTVKKIIKTHSCNKLRKGDPKFVVPTSYIVMIKPNYNMSEMVSVSSRVTII